MIEGNSSHRHSGTVAFFFIKLRDIKENTVDIIIKKITKSRKILWNNMEYCDTIISEYFDLPKKIRGIKIC